MKGKKFFTGLVFCVLLAAIYVVADFTLKTESGDLTLDPAGNDVTVDGNLILDEGDLYLNKTYDLRMFGKEAITTDSNSNPNLQFNYGDDLLGIYLYAGTGNGIFFGHYNYDEALIVRGDLRVDNGGVCVDDDGSCSTTNGVVKAVNFSTGHSDIAEMVKVDEDTENGDALCQYPDGSVLKCREPYSYSVIGIVSGKPGYLLNDGCGGLDSIFTVDDKPCAAPPENIEGCEYGGRCIGATLNEKKGGWNMDGHCNGTYMADDPDACDGWAPVAGFGEITAKVVCGRGGTDKTGQFEYSSKRLQSGDRLVSSDYGDGGYLEGIPGNKNAGDGLFAIAKEGCPEGEETATIRVWVR